MPLLPSDLWRHIFRLIIRDSSFLSRDIFNLCCVNREICDIGLRLLHFARMSPGMFREWTKFEYDWSGTDGYEHHNFEFIRPIDPIQSKTSISLCYPLHKSIERINLLNDRLTHRHEFQQVCDTKREKVEKTAIRHFKNGEYQYRI